MRLGLLGGTFDPFHNGHLTVARAAARQGLDRVAFVPARLPPHKDRYDIADPFHRFAMTALATVGEERLVVSPWEVARAQPSYTIETVKHFASKGIDVVLIMGSDSLAEIDTWRECRALLDLAAVMVYPRAPVTADRLEERMADWVRKKWENGSIVRLEGAADDTSSTTIRKLLREGRPVTGLVPVAVEEYIVKNHLYSEESGGGS